MGHIAAAMFFTLLFTGIGVALQAMVREYWAEIVAALRGDHLLRPTVYRAKIRRAALPARAAAMRRVAA